MELTFENVQARIKEYREMRLVQLVRREELVKGMQEMQAQLVQTDRNIVELDGATAALGQFEQPVSTVDAEE